MLFHGLSSSTDPQSVGHQMDTFPSSPRLSTSRRPAPFTLPGGRSRSVQILESPPPHSFRVLAEAPYTEAPEDMLVPGEMSPQSDASSLASPKSHSLPELDGSTRGTHSANRPRLPRRATTLFPSSPTERPPRWPYARPTLTRMISSLTTCTMTPLSLVQEEQPEKVEQIWYKYAKEASQYDQRMVSTWNRSLEVSIISAGIFSAILTPFVVESYTLLQTVRDPPPTFFGTNGYAIRVNAAWFGSLMISLIAALLSIHFRQWVEGYGASEIFSGNSDSVESLWVACRMRQYRYQNLKRYFIPELISLLPVLLYCALVLFAVGLIDFLWHLNKGIAIYISVLCGNTAAFHIITTIVPFFTTRSPFKTPLSNLLSNLWRGMWKKRLVVQGLLEADEAEDIHEQRQKLDESSFEWLMRHTRSEETFQDALRAQWEYTRFIGKSKPASYSYESPV